MAEGAVYVGRPTRWGNPWSVKQFGLKNAMRYFESFMKSQACEWSREALQVGTGKLNRYDIDELRGKDLACWCRLCDKHKNGKPIDEHCPDCDPCHADVLLELANQEPQP